MARPWATARQNTRFALLVKICGMQGVQTPDSDPSYLRYTKTGHLSRYTVSALVTEKHSRCQLVIRI